MDIKKELLKYKINQFKEHLQTGKILEKHLFIDLDQSYIDQLPNIIEILKIWYEHTIELKHIWSQFDRPEVNEVIIHSKHHLQLLGLNTNEEISLEKDLLWDKDLSLEVLALENNQDWNYSSPMASFHINDYRATLLHHCTSPLGNSKLFIRKHREKTFPLESFDINDINFYKDIINKKANILISGSTGSGKTSFIRSLLDLTQENDHTIILEDTYEIISKRANQTHMISNKHQGKSLKDYCKYAMRMSPSRIVLGEMRSDEVVPLILSLNSGQKGMLTTIHANNAKESISRLVLLFSLYGDNKNFSPEEITTLITKNIDYVVHLNKGKVSEVIKVLGHHKCTPLVEEYFY